MKHSILFVDDEPNILHALKRMLRPYADRWDMTCCDSANEAYRALEDGFFDAVVSDMRMPIVNGAEFLSRVRTDYPNCIRIALSGYSDSELIMESVKAAHIFLSKPAQPDIIISSITRALSLRALVDNEAVRTLVSKIKSLPSLPTIYEEINTEISSPNCSMHRIGEIVESDIGMSAKVLQLANSAFFGLAREVQSPVEAANFLGLETVRGLTLSIKVFENFETVGADGVDFSSLWSHSQLTASCARTIATSLGLPSNEVSACCTGGLLHDIGRLLLQAYFSEEYLKVTELVNQHGQDTLTAEMHCFGVTHDLLGSYLLGLWGLPNIIVESVAYHHDASQLDFSNFGPCEVVYLSHAIAKELQNDHELLQQIRVEGLVDEGVLQYCQEICAALVEMS